MTIAIPDLRFPKDFDPLFKIELRGPLSELEGMLDADFDKQIGFAWPANAVAWANQLMDQGKVGHVKFHGLRSAHRPLTKNLLLTAINGVRDRILDLALALELEQVSPELEQVESSGTVVQPEKMSAVYQVVVHTDKAFVGENITQFQHLQITPGDPGSLDRYLEGLGIGDAAQRRELVQHAEEAKAEDGPVKTAFKSTIDAVAKAVPNVAVELIEAAVNKWIAGGG